MKHKSIFQKLRFQMYDAIRPSYRADPPAGAAAAAPAATMDIKDLTLDQLKGIMVEATKGSNKAEIDALKKEILDTNRKAIFPYSDGISMEEAATGDVVDKGFFSKRYLGGPDAKTDAHMLAKQLVNVGGPFMRLSPGMETFARIIKCRFDNNRIQAAGIDIRKYNEERMAEYKQLGMSEGVAADGGVLVPVQYVATIIEFATQQSPILSKVWRLPMTTLTMKIPRLVQAAGSYFGGITLHWIDEAAEKTSTKPEMEILTFTAHKLIGLVYLTDELIADSMINVINYVTGLFTRAFQYEMERVIIQGSGVGQPLGIVNDPAVNHVARQVAGAIGYQDVINMDSALDENFQNLTWITRKSAQNTLMALRDSNQRPIFLADYSVFAGQSIHPPTMIGYPLYRTRNVPAVGQQGDIILGDLGMYIWAVRQDMTIDSSIHVAFTTDETCYRFVTRQDGKPGVSIAFAILDQHTS
jgi:HK97 family phage major capsid protein